MNHRTSPPSPPSPSSPPPPPPSPPLSRRRPLTGRVLLAVAVGGFVGSVLHTLVTAPLLPLTGRSAAAEGAFWLAIGASPGLSPLLDTAVLTVVNLLGSFLLGLLTGLASHRQMPSWLVSGLGVGMLGAFTTLSGVVVLWSLSLPPHGAADLSAVLGLIILAVLTLAMQALLGTLAGLGGLKVGGWNPEQVES